MKSKRSPKKNKVVFNRYKLYEFFSFLRYFNYRNYTKLGKQIILWVFFVSAVLIVLFLTQRFFDFWDLVKPEQKASIWIEVAKTIATIAGGIFVFWNIRITQEKQITERFTKAIEQLGDENNLMVRIGGIYALERIANDSSRDHWTVMEILTTFIRLKSNSSDVEKLKEIPQDVQAAIYVVGRRYSLNDPTKPSKRLNLSKTNFKGADLSGLDFGGANLCGACLNGSNLSRTNLGPHYWVIFGMGEFDLKPTWLSGADLRESILPYKNLRKIDLREAKLQKSFMPYVNLKDADLEEAILFGANFQGAVLSGTNMEKSDLRSVSGLLPEQVQSARNWERALYDSAFCKVLGLPIQEEKTDQQSS